ncbi:YkgJ family cysteine cluster protein [Alloalcanivorax marinus]|uniref:YkgJ family cysteine cluster protein n=1 Tax=Alloalcanivorax marinus TaxID=1177169 RepID=UPI00195DAE69|nr:YkgJ family cysteine cluster protein [Alloalcanivorax marinus]MBM7333041.1 YkgJ family cysteine cluster protein [Alloalcanivorax marinus]
MNSVSPEEFNRRCNRLYRQLRMAKGAAPSATSIGPKFIRPVEKIIHQIPAIDCRAGCSYCCNLRVVAFSFEIIAIYFYLVNSLTKSELEECKIRVRRQCEKIRHMTVSEHFATNITCPLLVGGECSVYPVRPLSCAGYHSASVDACRNSDENPELTGFESGGIPMFQEVNDAQSTQDAVAVEVLSKTRDDPHKYELIRSLWKIMENPKLIQRWKSGRAIFKKA